MLVLPQRQTALVAKQAAEVDLLSGGRLVLGVGTGWNHVEYTSLGTTFGDRARRFDDQVAVLRALWERRARRPRQRVPPDRAGRAGAPAGRRIPLWMGGSAEAALARAARVGDGHIFAGNTDRHFDAAARLVELLAEHGRDRATFGMDMFVDFADGPDVWHDRAQRWEQFGGSLMSMRSMTTGTSFLGVPAAGLSGPDRAHRRLGAVRRGDDAWLIVRRSSN